MQRVAQDWLILELGGGPLGLSLGVALQSAPLLLLGVWGGFLVDRCNVRWLLLGTQVVMAVFALILGVTALTGQATLPVVYVLAFGLGCASVLDIPARHAFVPELVGPDEIVNAVSLNSSINQAARLIGPAIAGLTIALAGTGVAFVVNACSFVALIVALVLLNGSELNARTPAARARGQIVEGLRYAWSAPRIRRPLLLTASVSMFAEQERVVLPLMAAVVFSGGANSYALLMSALGVGALGGALVCAGLSRPTHRMLGFAGLSLGLVLLVASLAPTYAVLAVLMVAAGGSRTAFNTVTVSLVLTESSAALRGRTMALRMLCGPGAKPIGALLIGWVCAAAGPATGLAVGGGVALTSGLLSLRKPAATQSTDRPARAPVDPEKGAQGP